MAVSLGSRWLYFCSRLKQDSLFVAKRLEMAGRTAIAVCFLILLVSHTEVSMSQRIPLTAKIRVRIQQRIRGTTAQGSEPLAASTFAATNVPAAAPAEAPTGIPGIDDGAAAPAPSGRTPLAYQENVQKVLNFLAKFIVDTQFVRLIYMGGKVRLKQTCIGQVGQHFPSENASLGNTTVL